MNHAKDAATAPSVGSSIRSPEFGVDDDEDVPTLNPLSGPSNLQKGTN